MGKGKVQITYQEGRLTTVGRLDYLVPVFIFSPILFLDHAVEVSAVDLGIEVSSKEKRNGKSEDRHIFRD